MATHSSTLASKNPWTEGPGRLQSRGLEESDRTEQVHFHFHALEKDMATHCCILAWWAAIYGFIQTWTRLMQLHSSSSIYSIGTR